MKEVIVHTHKKRRRSPGYGWACRLWPDGLKSTWKGLMLNRKRLLNFKGTNNIGQAGQREPPVVCILCCCSPRKLLGEAGPAINNKEK